MKKIGILGWQIGENSFGVTMPYLNWLDQFGNVRILDYKEPFDGTIDLLILPGGPDVNPERYNAIPDRNTGKPCIYREFFDMYRLPIYIENHVPIFGICRGLQTLNVAFGGTLHQNMFHETSIRSRDEIVHKIKYSIDGAWYLQGVNSLHHQIIDILGDELKVIAMYKVLNDKNKGSSFNHIEGIMHRDRPIAAVQYHPEELVNNQLANTIINRFLDGTFNNNQFAEL